MMTVMMKKLASLFNFFMKLLIITMTVLALTSFIWVPVLATVLIMR